AQRRREHHPLSDARHLLPSRTPRCRPLRRRRHRGRAGHDRRHHRGDEDDELGPRRRRRNDRRGVLRQRGPGRVWTTFVPRDAELMPEIEFVDTTTRDGNQSLWSATGLTTPDVVAIAPTMDQVGYHALDFTSSTHMAVSVRFHHEDPWERIRLVSAAM